MTDRAPAPAENDAPVCFRWMTYWPHAVPNVLSVIDTPHRERVTCPSCLHALGSQKHEPPRVIPPATTQETR